MKIEQEKRKTKLKKDEEQLREKERKEFDLKTCTRSF